MSRQGLYDHNGILFKWTNYWTGWQSRWFILKDGILAYYDSDEEVTHGCKASVNVSAVDMQVDSADSARFVLSLQDGQHWYLKANNSAERQKWLIALGTAKARKSTNTSRDEIFHKMSELRLYYDALHSHIKNLKKVSVEDSSDVEKITEISNILSATCDTFLLTLEDCMKIAEGSYLPMHTRRISSEETPVVLQHSDLRYTRSQSADASFLSPKRTRASSRLSSPKVSPNNHPEKKTTVPSDDSKSSNLSKLKVPATSIPSKITQHQEANTISEENGASSVVSTKELESSGSEVTTNAKEEEVDETHLPDIEPEYLTFFSAMLHSFTDIEMEEDGGVPSSSFLDACDDLLPFFDKIGSTAFAPVRMDLQGNITKVRTKMLTNPAQFHTVQNIVKHEMDTKTTKVRNSATDAILWLKRGLRFIQVFLNNLKDGKRNSATALNEAYAVTLKQHHNWVVRGIFAVAARAIPSNADLYNVFGSRPETSDPSLPSRVLTRDIDNYVTAVDVVLTVLDSFYNQHSLDAA